MFFSENTWDDNQMEHVSTKGDGKSNNTRKENESFARIQEE